ncbi:polysaccharide biosynthesis/export family protein [Marivita sp. S0852]|uniref:polysaccharide biosynthesis/export family protein n=1 Tax=Marivita sp. S0852 TaxID=3373893 RepID=UPI0039825EBC
MIRKTALLVASLLSMVACAPADGPSSIAVVTDARQNQTPILQLSDEIVSALGTSKPATGFSSLGASRYTPGVIKPGDTISVTAFGTGEGGLFNPTTSAALPLGDFVVSQSGTVSLPFVGGINVGGRSVKAAQDTITARLRETAVDPFATVSIARKESDSYSVQGAVASAGVFNLTSRGESVLDGLANAGGATGTPDATVVTVLRSGRSAQETLAQVVSDPRRNIPLLPGDTVIVGGGDAQFVADGALAATGEFDFVEGSLTLAQAIARAGGLLDSRADPKDVFLFRRQPAGESFILVDQNRANPRTIFGDVIFRVNYADPSQRLNASRFQMRDGDSLYVGNAPLANFSKYFQIFSRPPELPAPPQP